MAVSSGPRWALPGFSGRHVYACPCTRLTRTKACSWPSIQSHHIFTTTDPLQPSLSRRPALCAVGTRERQAKRLTMAQHSNCGIERPPISQLPAHQQPLSWARHARPVHLLELVICTVRVQASAETPSGRLLASRIPPHPSTQALLLRQPTPRPQVSLTRCTTSRCRVHVLTAHSWWHSTL